MAESFLPPDLERAHDLAHEALAWANTVASLVEDAKYWTDDPENLDKLCREAAEALHQLLRAVQAVDTPDSMMVELSNAYDDPAIAAGKSFTSFHKAANWLANEILERVWHAAEPNGMREYVLDLGKVAKAWPKVHETLTRRKRTLPEIDEGLSVMLTKEAAKAAANRSKVLPPPRTPAKPGKGKPGRKSQIDRDEDWLAEYEQMVAEGTMTSQAAFAARKGVVESTVSKAFERARAERAKKDAS